MRVLLLEPSLISPTILAITSARYIIPATCSIITNGRACGAIGMTSESPVEVSVVKDRKSSSIQLRAAVGSTDAMNEPGRTIWTTGWG